MRPLKTKLQNEAIRTHSRFDIIEKDYAQSYVLAGITKQPELSHSLVFKGGTALKKIFFKDYRFSVDLDFSTQDAPKGQALEKALRDALQISNILLSSCGPFEFQLKRFSERVPHPSLQEAFNIFVKFPWHRSPLCTIKIEVTHDEPVVLTPVRQPIFHGYDEKFDFTIACYHIEEVIAEKLRALLQTHQNLVTRGWNKPRARDYYDLWSVLKHCAATVDHERLLKTLDQKCAHRHVSYKTIDDFFTPELTKEASQHWQATLSGLVLTLPTCERVLQDTKSLIEKILF